MFEISKEMFAVSDTMLAIIGFVFGTIFSSFFTLVGYRVPRGISIVTPPSHCGNCKHQLHLIDLIPIASYLIHRGKCNYCKTPYGSTHLWTELLTGTLFAIACFLLYSHWILLIIILILFCYVNVEVSMTTQSEKELTKNITQKMVLVSISIMMVFLLATYLEASHTIVGLSFILVATHFIGIYLMRKTFAIYLYVRIFYLVALCCFIF